MALCHTPDLLSQSKKKKNGKHIKFCLAKHDVWLFSFVVSDCLYCFKLFSVVLNCRKKQVKVWNENEEYKSALEKMTKMSQTIALKEQ